MILFLKHITTIERLKSRAIKRGDSLKIDLGREDK